MSETKGQLWEKITLKRREMGEAYELEGGTEKALALSQELDQLLNQYDELLKSEAKDQ